MRNVRLIAVVAAGLQISLSAMQVNTVSGVTNAVPKGYVPPLVSNGSLSMLIDYQGGQTQQYYVKMKPTIYWAGRRYDPPASRLIPFGHFDWGLSIDGRECKVPETWSQSLDISNAVVSCVNEYAGGLKVETTVFTPLNHDMIVLKRRLICTADKPLKVWQAFRYQLTPPGEKNVLPWRVTGSCSLKKESEDVLYRYWADGHPYSAGAISIFSDKPVTAGVDGQRSDLRNSWTIEPGKPHEQCYYLIFTDTLDGKDYMERHADKRAFVRKTGFEGLLTEHEKAWGDYWNDSFVQVPDKNLQRMYDTAQYHLRANATKWSFPVGIFDSHWSGRYFGWDEMFCYQALVSSNHKKIARHCPEFRKSILKKVLYRKAHYGKPGKFGAQYPWETIEDGSEGAPPYGFWADHVFHMSNIALSAWYQYLYTDDIEYLKKTGYPVMMECARFFLANMVYENADGSMFIGKCTDLERLGTSRRNPFMTSCGAIYTMESAAEAAELLGINKDEVPEWKHAAAKLRESLPHANDRYVPYLGCPEESVASIGGLFPYPLFDTSSTLQKNAAYHFVAEGKASGNMYPVGKSICAWYAGWMAAALALLDDKTEPVKLLDKAAEGAGCFGEMFEINEPAVSRTPWFSTASGNVVYALNQMLVQSRGDSIHFMPAAPVEWKNLSFKLACHGDLTLECKVENGRLVKLDLVSGKADKNYVKTVVLPKGLADGVKFDESVVTSRKVEEEKLVLAVKFKGDASLIKN